MAIEKAQVRLEAAGSIEKSPPAASPDDMELKRRLTFDSPQLMGELYEITKAQIQAETGRQGRIEAKATALLTATGLSLTVAFTFGGVLFGQR